MKEMLKTLIRRSFAASRERNLISVLAIALTAVMFTSVTTIGMGTSQSMTLTMQMQKGSRSDGDFRNMTEAQFQMLQEADFIESAGLRMPVSFLSNTKRHNIEFDVLDETQAELTFCSPTHGKVPVADNEIVASDLALRDLGAEPEVGEEVTVEFVAHGKEYCLTLVVSGWYEAINDQTSMMWAGTAFRDAHPDIFLFTYDQDGETAGTYQSDFTASNTAGLQEKIEQLSISMGGEPYDVNAENYLPAVVNTMTNPTIDPQLIIMAAVIVVLFVFCGYLLIYNVFDIAVMQEIRRYGLYRTIGMSKKQVKKLINRQALWLSCIGIPLGLLIGFFIGKAALPVIMNTISTDYTNVASEVSPSPIIFLGAVLLTALTVFLSTRKPVKVAANIPPIEAFRYVESHTGKRTKKKSSLGANIPRLALSNMGRNRRRSTFIIISLMLCVTLLNSVGTVAESLDVEKQVAYMIRTDFAVTNVVSTNGMRGFTSKEDALNEQAIEAIAAQPGVTEASSIYKNTVEDTDVTYEWDHVFLDDGYTEDSGLYFRFDENGMAFAAGDDNHPICNVYGMEESAVARMDLREGETNAHSLYEKMSKGEGVIVGVNVNRVNMSIDKDFDFIDVGENITVYKDGQPVMELPVLAKAAINGDDQEIGFTCNGPLEVGGDGLFLYLPTNIYKELYDDPVIYKYAFNVEESQRENMTAFLNHYINNVDTSINYLSSQSARENAAGIRTMIRFVGGLVGVIFGIAGVLNLINTLVTTILTRRHEFATMQSIGMTNRQLTQMMIFEGVYYAVGACLLGLVLAALLNLTIVQTILRSMWQFTFHFTLLPALIVSVILLIVSAIVPVLALKFFNKGSIVEQLRVAE